jgi:hypothetical protein
MSTRINRCIRVFAAALALWIPCAQNSLFAEVILSEIMYDPQNGGADREWVEIFNTGTSPVNIGGWQFGVSGNNDWANALPANTMLGASQALVITPDSSTFDSGWGSGINRIQVSNFPALTNDPNDHMSAATLAIRNGSGVIQDQVTYEDGSGWPTTNGNDGNSIYVLPQYLTSSLNNSGANWKPSSQGVYGAVWKSASGPSENHASPGKVATTVQDPFEPSPDAAWSMVFLPDVQNYNSSDGNQAREIAQMNWILNNKTAFNIKAVLQGGDIVNQNDTDSQWARAKEAFHMLDGQVPYVLAAGNHDFGNNNFENRNTQYNNYFKITDNPLNNPATGGIIKGTFQPNKLENSYSTFTAPDGRKMLIFNLEFYPRQAVLDWADSIAGQAQFADYTAMLLTHAFIGSGATRWNASPSDFPVEGNDGVDMWNELVKVNGNFEMTYNGHFGGDGNSFREDPNNAGVDVHQIFLDTQWETNGGNGWMQVIEFLKDGQGVRVRTYSPHFDLYRTNAAGNLNFDLTHVDSPLIWNTGADLFSNGFVRSNGNLAVGVTGCDPYGADGKEVLIVGFNGVASISSSASHTVASLRVGTNAANAYITGRNGDGAVNVGGATNLTLSSSTGAGDLTVGEGGFTGTMNWNSSGTLMAQGKLRIGQGGVGIFNQTAGVVIGGNTSGSLKYVGIGVNAGSQGTYNLNGGTLRPSGGFAGTEFRQLVVGDVGATGELNVGDGIGAAASAAIETNDDLYVGRSGGTGLMRVRPDGKVELRTSSNAAEFFVGQDSTGTVLQTGGTVKTDNTMRIGSEPGGIGQYTISAGSLNTASDGSGTFTIGRNGGIGTLRVEGTGQVTHGAELLIGDIANAITSGRLELVGNTASMQIGQLENAAGGTAGIRETMFWQAAAAGVTPLVVTGAGPLSSNRVQLQDPTELAANTGTNGSGNLTGDGTALELDLSAITTNMVLTLIDNRTTDAITGFFEKGATKSLYEEGEVIPDTGFDGTVTISYHGGTGNDVTLNLVTLLGDYNHDGNVNAADYVGWRKTEASNQQNYVNWRASFGQLAPSLGSPLSSIVLSTQVPEPATFVFLVVAWIWLSASPRRKNN